MSLSLLSLVLSLGAGPEAPPPERLALIIANNRSRDAEVRPLRFADDDGARFYELLTAVGFSAQLFTVLDADTAEQFPQAAKAARPPTWERLERAVRELRRQVGAAHTAGREVELFISYSGHGAVGSRGVPYLNLLDRRLYRGDFFNELVAAIGADFVHLVIDACRARDFVDARGGPDGPEFDRELSLFLAAERRVAHPEVGIVVAESADGETHEWARTRSGIFGHEVISGLAGGADVNGDGLVEYSELHAFVAAANHALRDPRARLRVTAQPPPLNPRRPLVRLADSAGAERIRTPVSGGRYTIEDDRGVRWVDVNLAAGQESTLYLPRRGRFYVIDVNGHREAALDPPAAPGLTLLTALAFGAPTGAVARGSVAEALASDLFRTPYGAEFYRGFIVALRYPSAEEPALAPISGESASAERSPPSVLFEPSTPPTGTTPPALPAPPTASMPPVPPTPTSPAPPPPGTLLEPPPIPSTPLTSSPPPLAARGWPLWRLLRWGGGGLAAVTLVSAGATGYVALDRQDSLHTIPQREAKGEVRTIRRLAVATDVLLALAVVGVGAWAISFDLEE